MTDENLPDSGFDCPRCDGTLETWARAQLQVEFCDTCSALFLDRGELFRLFGSEGYNCPPEAELRLTFSAHEGDELDCPKCRKRSLMPGTVEGVELWRCTPCNGSWWTGPCYWAERRRTTLPSTCTAFADWGRRPMRRAGVMSTESSAG